MGIFDFLRVPDIDAGIREYAQTPDALLLDVRTEAEYREGHIPGSKNLPVQQLEKLPEITDRRDAAVFVYCLSGARARQALRILNDMGYSRVKNLGGIAAYTGKVER